MDMKRPQQLGRLLPEHAVHNYGVSGYSVGQTYLRFKDAHARVTQPARLAPPRRRPAGVGGLG
jgi:hypothetical protein